ncbi:MAG TPA: DUF433 domain-containing protein [Thermoanaerobaculia bacterium]|jgi:uncharacterized protein (DUF433 family)|nr:DUF433 domain-containing protein [Thermoanaerobaculia bacterium]
MADLKSIIHSHPEIHSGDPVFVGTRVPVRTLLDYIEGGDSLEVFLDNFPSVGREQAVAFLEEAGRVGMHESILEAAAEPLDASSDVIDW